MQVRTYPHYIQLGRSSHSWLLGEGNRNTLPGASLQRLTGDIGQEQIRHDMDGMGGGPILSQVGEETGVMDCGGIRERLYPGIAEHLDDLKNQA